MKEKNRGFTLVELIVSIAILGIVTIAAFSLMVAGSNTFGSVGTRLDLQLEAQLAANQIEAYIIDCNENLYFDGAALYVINSETDAHNNKTYTAHVFEYVGDEINYAVVTDIVKNFDGSFAFYYTADSLLCGKVRSFGVVLSPAGGERAEFAEISLTLEYQGKQYSLKKNVAPRNKPTIKSVE